MRGESLLGILKKRCHYEEAEGRRRLFKRRAAALFSGAKRLVRRSNPGLKLLWVLRTLAMTILWGVIVSSSTKNLSAGEVPKSFQEVNQLYANGKFSEAISAYQNLLKSKTSAEIYYNLGNAYFKDGQIGKAILNYEQAKRLNPRDLDIRSNLTYSNRLIEYKIEDKRGWYLRKISDLISYFRFEECWLLFFVSYSIFLISLLISFVRKRPLLGKINSVLLILVIITFFPLLLKFGESGMNNEAIVTVKQAEVRYGPSTVDRIAFRLVEGLKTTIHDHKQDWYRIRLRDGRSGWVRDSEVSVI